MTLENLDTLLLVLFAFGALAGALMMIALREPMHVALALISTMLLLGAIYGLLGVHFIAAFQVLIYVGAVMVFMVYVIMLLEPRTPKATGKYSRLLVPGVIAFALLVGMLVYAVSLEPMAAGASAPVESFGLRAFAIAFLNEYWLHFELTSVLLVAAVVAAVAVIRLNRRNRG